MRALLVSLVKRSWDSLSQTLTFLWALIKKPWLQIMHGSQTENEKIVLRKTLWPALAKCSVHTLPVVGTITLSYFNLHGYYIGTDFKGKTYAAAQELDRLCLQVTAKLLVRHG